MGISRRASRARWALRMSRSMRPPLARLTSASASPVSKWTTLSRSRLLYGSPQRRTGMWIMSVYLVDVGCVLSPLARQAIRLPTQRQPG